MMIAMRNKHNMKTLRHFKIKKRLLFEFAMYEHWLAYEFAQANYWYIWNKHPAFNHKMTLSPWLSKVLYLVIFLVIVSSSFTFSINNLE